MSGGARHIALGRQPALPETVLADLVRPCFEIRRAMSGASAADALQVGNRHCPRRSWQTLEPCFGIRRAMSGVARRRHRVLGRQALPDESFYLLLVKMDSQSFINLYGEWLSEKLFRLPSLVGRW